MKTYLIPTSTVEHLVKNILAKAKNFEIIFPDLNKERERYFPDGEVYIRISKVAKLKNKRVIVLHSGAPKPNEGLIELELILEILKDNNIKPEVFFSYFPYGMQDKVFERGETNAAENLIRKLINYYRVRKIYLIDAHFGGRKWVKKYCLPGQTSFNGKTIINISAVPLLIKKAKRDFKENILFLSPDKGETRRTGILGIKKERLNSFKIKILSPKMVYQGKIVGVIDDLIETGITLLKFFKFAKKSGAKKVIALVAHGVLASGIAQIKKKYFKLYLTDTIAQKMANVDVTDLILKTISL